MAISDASISGISISGSPVASGSGLALAIISVQNVTNAWIAARPVVVNAVISDQPTVNVEIVGSLPVGALTYQVGGESIITCTVTDGVTGALVDPGSVLAYMQTPDQVITEQTVTRVSQGIYQFVFVWAEAGSHTAQFIATAPYQFNQYSFYKVQVPAFIP